jgi:hypothetical protein
MYSNFLQEQKFINESICPLNCVAQFVWNGGFMPESIFGASMKSELFSTKGATAVPGMITSGHRSQTIKWTREAINTRPQSI